jgi:hypothetical protein
MIEGEKSEYMYKLTEKIQLNKSNYLQHVERLSEKSGTNGNCNYLSYLYLQVKFKG